jgi:omega-6 fatty acid desaturase (delta-12 desaturase)
MVAQMRTGKDLILATKPFASDTTARSWWYILSTAILLLLAVTGTLWNFHFTGKLVCGFLTGLLMLRLFVIYHDQQHHISALFPS